MHKAMITLLMLTLSRAGMTAPVTPPVTHDTMMSNATRFWLAKTVNQAMDFSPEIRVAGADKQAADFDIDRVKGARWPQIQLGTTAPMASFGSGSHTGNNRLDDSSLSLNVTTTLFDWGKNRENIGSATQQANAATYQYDYQQQQIAYSTLSQLIELSRNQQNQKITQAYVKRMRTLVNMLVEITQTDAGRHSELVQARAKLLAAEASLQRVTDQRKQVEITLFRLTGEQVSLPDNFDWTMQPIPTSLVISRVEKHPTWLKAQAEAESAAHDVAAAEASTLPQLNWVIAKSTAKDSYGNPGQWYTGLNIQWNAFTGGTEKAAIQAASARASARQSQFTQTHMDMEYQIHNLSQSRDAAEIQSREYQKLSQETDMVSKIYYEQWLRLGKRTLLDVLTAENDCYNNHIAAVNARHDAYSANVKLVTTASMTFEWFGLRANKGGRN
ncbi:MAG: TolC family protein [Pantoea sp.]|uniref:TolC family protein n=1 Tax=Pantoea sp. TaxID=69393 RepID=UPI00238E325C|nr:TolC family protein [Pantoea sp.]MDE1185124.1 TolC family protein [Pantoea sp.]